MLHNGIRFTALLCSLAFATMLSAQNGTFQFTPQFPAGLGFGDTDSPVTFSAEFEVAEGTDRGQLHVTAVIGDPWYMYSVTQQDGGPVRTKITLKNSAAAKLLGPFSPAKPPKKSTSDVYPGITIEKHFEKVVWTAPIQFVDASKAATAEIELGIDAQRCQDQQGQCVLIDEAVTAKFKGTYKPKAATGEFREEGSVVQWNAWIEPSGVRAGDEAKLMVVATMDEGYHIYQAATSDAKFSTVLIVTKKSGVHIGAPVPSTAPVKHEVKGVPPVFYHDKKVAWSLPIEVLNDAKAGEHQIEVVIGYLACTMESCLEQRGLKLSGNLVVGKDEMKKPVPMAISAISFREVAESAAETGNWVDGLSATKPAGSDDSQYSIALALAFGLLGGLILNMMPCVLPVIGLKVMSFVEQAGQDRGRVLALNLWYTLGLLSVFWVLAAVVILFRVAYGESFAWGQQFTYFEFRLGLMIFIFAMALSFLGTWEIPLPGFTTGSTAGGLQRKEGASGAFAKGVFTTVLATPCSGPFLGPVFAFMLTQSNAVVISVFTSIGLGMALPYLLIGMFPAAIGLLPKPGPWMETMKQGLSFLLLATVVWLFDGTPQKYQPAVFGTLMAVWLGCWLIGRVPNWEAIQRRLTAWGTGISVAVGLSLLMFHLMVPGEDPVKWEPYTEARLASLQQEGKTVMVDFTADWCANCKVNYKFVLNTESMAELLEQHGVVPMLADWSEKNEEIKAKLTELNSNSIPLLAIYPGDDPANPILLHSLVTEAQVQSAIEMASPKNRDSNATSVAYTTSR